MFLWGLRQFSGLTLREAGKQAGGMHYLTVSTAIRRLEQRAKTDNTVSELQRQLRQLANDETYPSGSPGRLLALLGEEDPPV